MGRSRIAILFAVLFCACLTGCKETPHGTFMVDVDASGWSPDEHHAVVYDNIDTLSLRTVRVVAKVGREFDGVGGVLPLTVTCSEPGGDFTVGTIELRMTSAKSRAASFAELGEPFVLNAKFGRQGAYRFDFAPNTMRKIDGVLAVGIELEEQSRKQ